MKNNNEVFEEAFDLLCGPLIGEGIHRQVFTCRLREDLVVKVEDDDYRYFANVLEQKFWDDHQYDKRISKWLAPCEYLSPDGRILLQKRATPCQEGEKMPEKVPAFLSDLKAENFGRINGKLVCIDYAMTIPTPSLRLKKAHWI